MIDPERIGRSIRALREKANYTQKDLAERLFLSPMAVSKWERGISVPDVSCLQRLAVILDTDVDSILDASSTYMNRPWKGMIYLEHCPASSIVHDKPVIDYLISYFLLSGIRHISIVAPSDSIPYIQNRFSNGDVLGCSFSYKAINGSQSLDMVLNSFSQDFSNHRIMLLSKPLFLYGVDLTRFFQRILYAESSSSKLCTVKGHVYGHKIGSNPDRTLKEALPPPVCLSQYHYSELPFFFFDYNSYSDRKKIGRSHTFIPMDKGFVDIDLTEDTGMRDASTFVRIVQEYNGYLLNCPFEIAWRRGMISHKDLLRIIDEDTHPEYTEYLRDMVCSD